MVYVAIYRIGLFISFQLIRSDTSMDSLLNMTLNSSSMGNPNFTPSPGNTLEYTLNCIKCLIGILGAFGNALVCVVVWRVRREQNFTNSLIVSQAAIDLVTSLILIASVISLAVPAPVPQNHGLAVLYCIFWHSRVILFACWAISTFNLTGIAIERYLAVIHPIWYHQHFTRKTAWVLVIMAWLIAPVMQTIVGIRTGNLRNNPDRCVSFYNSSRERAALGVLIFLWDYFIPVAIMAFAFIKMAIRLNKLNLLKKRRKAPSTSSDTEPPGASPGAVITTSQSGLSAEDMKAQIMKRKNITKTLFTVFALYVFCWTPEQILFLQFSLGGHLEFGGALHTVALILATSNSAMNPFVYALRFKQYQKGLKSLCEKIKSDVKFVRRGNDHGTDDHSDNKRTTNGIPMSK